MRTRRKASRSGGKQAPAARNPKPVSATASRNKNASAKNGLVPKVAHLSSSHGDISIKEEQEDGSWVPESDHTDDNNFKTNEYFIKKEPFEEEIVIEGSNEHVLITKNEIESSDESESGTDHDIAAGSGFIGGDATEWTMMTPMVQVGKGPFEVTDEQLVMPSPSEATPSRFHDNVTDLLVQADGDMSNKLDRKGWDRQGTRGGRRRKTQSNSKASTKGKSVGSKSSVALDRRKESHAVSNCGLDNQTVLGDSVLKSIKIEPLSDLEDQVKNIPGDGNNFGKNLNPILDLSSTETEPCSGAQSLLNGRPKRNIKHKYIGVSRQSKKVKSTKNCEKSTTKRSSRVNSKKCVVPNGSCNDTETEQNPFIGLETIQDDQQAGERAEAESIIIKQEPVSDLDEDDFEANFKRPDLSSLAANSDGSGFKKNTEPLVEESIPEEALTNMVYIHKPSNQVFACKGESKGLDFKFQCAVCQEVFQTSIDTVKHVARHDVPVNFFCSECQNSFPTADAFQEHKAGHKKKQSFRIILTTSPGAQGSTVLVNNKVSDDTGIEMVSSSQVMQEGDTIQSESLKKTGIVHNNKATPKLLSYSEGSYFAEVRIKEEPTDDEDIPKEALENMVYIHKPSNQVFADGKTKSLSYKFQCAKCKEAFKTSLALIKHVAKHEETVNYYCYECEKSFPTVEEYKIHIVGHKTKPHICEICNAAFSQPWRLKSHMETHAGMPLSNICSVCGSIFQEFSSLRRHMNCHVKEYSKGLTSLVEKLDPRFKSERESFPCNQCDQVFNSKTRRSVHVRYHHKKQLVNECKFCRKTFFSPSELKRHLRTHTGEKPYACPECGQSYALTSTLQDHMRRHTGERPFKCSICEKTFSSSSCLGRHKLTHVGKKNYECEECGKDFLHRNSLKIHTRTHTGARPYKCETCNKTFSMSCHYRVHLRIHTGERPYKCNYCKRDFNNYGSHYRHVRTHVEWRMENGEAVQESVPMETEESIPPIIEVKQEVNDIDTDETSSKLEGKLLKSMLATSVSPKVLLQEAARGNISKETMASLEETSGEDLPSKSSSQHMKGGNSDHITKRSDSAVEHSPERRLPSTSSVIAKLLQTLSSRN